MVNKIFKSRYVLLGIQFFTLLIFVMLIYGAIGVFTNDPDFAKILRNTNLSNLIVWSYWWPLIIVSAIFFGRFWCTICPMELITSLSGKLGLKRKPGKILKSGWIITLFYAIILIIGIHTLQIHRIPQNMAVYMLVLFALAAIAGLIWEKRTFCTYICPIGHLLGLYSLLSFNKLRVKDKLVCKNCKTKDCISKQSHYKLVGRSCTSELFPPKLKDNRDCILCGQCHKSCSKDNIAVQKRKFASDLFKDIKLTWAEISFFIIVSGFVVYEILSEWKVSKKVIMRIPDFINDKFQISSNFSGTIKAILLFVLLPALFYFIFALIKKQFSGESWKNAFTQLVFTILPITAGMHILKAILKITSRIPYWNFAVTDPQGIESTKSIMQNPDVLHNNFLSFGMSHIASVFAILLPVIGVVLSIYVIKKQNHYNRASKMVSLFAMCVYAGIFLFTIISWKVV